MTAYIIMVQSLIDGSAKVSSEGYTSLADAERFVLASGYGATEVTADDWRNMARRR